MMHSPLNCVYNCWIMDYPKIYSVIKDNSESMIEGWSEGLTQRTQKTSKHWQNLKGGSFLDGCMDGWMDGWIQGWIHYQ